jgi:glycosyltransferase involved in cell wall biosynthesis
MVKISLLHPSRGRPYQSDMNSRHWFKKTEVEVELICAVDSSDEKKWLYEKVYGDTCHIFPSENVVEATNFAAQKATGDILVYLSDDFRCPDNWGELILKEFENENRPLVLKVHDGLQKFDARVLTIPIMNRMLYDKLGYFFHPSYKSMWVDCDLFETCQAIGAIKSARHLEFPHHHHSNPNQEIRSERDEIYMRSEANWNQGLEMFQRRKAERFQI